MSGLTHPLAWWLANPVIPSKGQQCLIVDLGLYKVGDGLNYFSALPIANLPPVSIWYSTYQNIVNNGTTVQNFEIITLLGGTFVQEGGKATFEAVIKAANNSNSKTVNIYFAGNLLFTYTVPLGGNQFKITGFIKVTDYIGQKAFFSININNGAPTTGNLTGINWAADNILQLTGKGVSTGDLTYTGGDGMLLPIQRFNID